ncbi:hypothetical protein [Rhizorhabdus dicambivorans]|uniref:Uncharacterized protein n=1 Tax=Rhizorhabdus dicambivorans TaxID=1850238 RepID=A0A2A4FYS3_9SPHN|nr:hypothetical protein [Rhizorhabdus dicambivorans]ATE63727.1 hypothetical protein CMV14_04385 [Rhizorhabdus dicambivorans]PCE42857.1 hypothetical protein COO09_08520 [Rhizorhabdus dicambivorans]
MGIEPTDFTPSAGVERELVSGEEIRRRVQAMIDDHPALRDCGKKVIAPMPKPTASESLTGCNWTMHYLGQFPGCEPIIDEIVALVQHEANIAGPATGVRP